MEMQDRFQTAIKEARKEGAKVRQNVQQCCRSCVTYQKLGFKTEEERDTTPLAWTYGGQGSAYSWPDDKGPVYRQATRSFGRRSQARVDRIYFNHDNGGGEIIAEAMKRNGFTVDWDGSFAQCVVVVFETVDQ